MHNNPPQNYYLGLSSVEILNNLKTDMSLGLTDSEAAKRYKKYGKNSIKRKKNNFLKLFLQQVTGNPLLLILIGATILSLILGDRLSSFYILGIILLSIILGFWNEYSAEKTVDNLLKKITNKAIVIRNSEKIEIPFSSITIGDIVLVAQGSMIPADIRFLETNNLEVDESSLTGEAKTVIKNSDTIVDGNSPSQMLNIGFMGTNITSGSGKGVVIAIGENTQFGEIASSTTFEKPITEFQKGLSDLGKLIIKFVIILTIVIFIINALLKHDILTSFLFSLAIAVGITPELLPVIVTVSLSHGAGKLAKKHVIVKRLLSLENLGNIDVLCTDKTGTLTEGKIDLVDHINLHEEKDINVLTASLLCNTAIVHKKISGNAIDVALWQYAIKSKIYLTGTHQKIFDQEFDYNHKINFSVIKAHELSLFAKGAPESMLPRCINIKHKKEFIQKLDHLREQGYRIIVIAQKKVDLKKHYTFEDVSDMECLGYITFLDIPKKSASEALNQLKSLNVVVKILTGDSDLVTRKICSEVGIDTKRVITGPSIDRLTEVELRHVVNTVDIFARLLPLQKLKIIKALQANGHTVGYLGDGINDLPSLHNADVGISVNSAVDVAKEASSVVLLRKGIDVISDGIKEGRRTFSNTIKYIIVSASSNFGNMFSATGASFLLPFLPMTPVQLLLTNTLYDFSQLSIPTDSVDNQALLKPRHWKIEYIKNYMLFFGPLSSVFDFLTFSILIIIFDAKNHLFQTGWFIESLATQTLIVFAIRTTKRPFYLSRPSLLLVIASFLVIIIGIILPLTPLATQLGFVSPPPLYFVFLILIVISYLLLIDYMKGVFLKKFNL